MTKHISLDLEVVSGATTGGTVDGVLRRSVARFPGNTALTFDGRDHSYRELDEAVTRVAACLISLGLNTGGRVIDQIPGVCTRRTDTCAGELCTQGGELKYLLSQSGARAVLVDPTLEDTLTTVSSDLVAVEHILPLREAEGSRLEVAGAGAVPNLIPASSPTDLVQLLYTSGTTQNPRTL